MKTGQSDLAHLPGLTTAGMPLLTFQTRGYGYSRHAAPWQTAVHRAGGGEQDRMPCRISHLQVRGAQCAA